MPTSKGILMVINCGREQGMEASAFGGDERTLVRRMAKRGKVRIVREEGIWVYATLPDPVVTLHDKYSGNSVTLTLRDGFVIGAMGTEPNCYMGKTMKEALTISESKLRGKRRK